MPNQVEIEYGRIPDASSCFSIGRSKLYELIAEGKIKSVAVKRKGSRCGIRLIDMQSVRDFLKAQTQ